MVITPTPGTQQASAGRKQRSAHLALFAAVTASAFLATGCNGTQAVINPTLTVGGNQAAGASNGPLLVTDSHSGGDTFFTLALPPDAPLPKITTQVAGQAGSFSTPLTAATQPTITSVIPNQNGFIIEGAGLNTGSLTFYLGSYQLAVTSRTATQVIANIQGSTMPTAGVFSVRNGGTQLLRFTADAKNVNVYGRVVVKFLDGAPRATIESALQGAGVRYYRYLGMDYLVAYVDPSATFKTVQASIQKNAVFTSVTTDTIYYPQDTKVSDPMFPQQWALPMIHAPAGWDYSTGSPDTIVAVLDTGVDVTHPDLSANIYRNAGEIKGNGKDDDGNGWIDDVNGWNAYDQNGDVSDQNGHGTQMAGIIAAASNTFGIAGLAFSSRILPVKVSNAQGVSTSSSIINGIDYAVRNRAGVINISLATKNKDTAVEGAIQFANEFNIQTVSPMGNDGQSLVTYPAGWALQDNIIAVGATNSVDARPNYSNYGSWITVAAPGDKILTTAPGGGFVTISGTSAAAAYVSGEVALIKAMKPGYTPAQVKQMVEQLVVTPKGGTPGFNQYFGYGRIDLGTGLAALGSELGIKNITASSQHFLGIFPPKLAGDLNTETYWSSERTAGDGPEWLLADGGSVQTLSSIALMSGTYYPFLFPADFTLECSQDGKNWTTLASEVDFQIGTSQWYRWNFTPRQARYVRVNITKRRLNPDNQLYYAQVAEMALNGAESGIIQTASSDYYGMYYMSSNLTDNDPNSYWVSENAKTMTPEFVIADLGSTKAMSSIDMLSVGNILPDSFPKAFTLSVSNDKVHWTQVANVVNQVTTPSTWYHYPISATSARYIRVDISKTNRVSSNGSLYGGYFLSGYTAAIAEVQVNRTP